MPENSLPPDHEQRRLIIEQLDQTMLVEASAGTGKTTSLVGRMVALVGAGRCTVDRLAAVTFTRKATAELRARFQVELERAAREATGQTRARLDAAVAEVERCFIGTIHSFCARLLRERPIEAGVDLTFRELEEQEDQQLREQAWAEYVAGLFVKDIGELAELRGLGLEIGQLRSSFIAFAGYPDVGQWPSPDVEIGDLDPSVRALQDYVAHMDALADTFPVDRGSDKLMATYERIVRLARNRDLHRPAHLIEVLEQFNPRQKVTQKYWPGGQPQGAQERDRWVEFSETIAQSLVRRWRENRYQIVIRILAGARRVYDRLRKASGRLNYQDLLMRAAALLRDKPAVRRYFRGRFTHLLVDEFQDTDPVQAQVMLLLTAEDLQQEDWRKCVPVPGSLFVVGDPKQSIFRFRRADIVTYNQVKEIIVSSGGAVVPLSANFRTIQELVEWGNGIFNTEFPAQANQYSPAACPMQVGRHGGSAGVLAGLKVLEIPEAYANKDAAIDFDADLVVRSIRHALDAGLTVPRSQKELERGIGVEVTPGDFLIVTWGKKQLAQYARKLQDLGIPHQVTGGSALDQVRELQLLADCLQAVTQPENPVALVAVLRGELFGFSDAELYAYRRRRGRFSYRARIPEDLETDVAQRFETAFERLRRYATWLRQLPPVPAMERTAVDLGLPQRSLVAAGGDVQAGSIAKAFQMLRAAQAELPSAVDLAEYLAELIENEAEFDGLPARAHREPVVRLMNLHKVKGLEAPIVYLANPQGKWQPPVTIHVDRTADLVRGYLAIYGESSSFHAPLLACPPGWEDQAEEESRFEAAEKTRLLYVAATRAGTQLVITQKAKSNGSNYWQFFQPYLMNAAKLVDPGAQSAPAGLEQEVTPASVESAAQQIGLRWGAVCKPTYNMAAAKEISVSASALHRPVTSGEHGTEWGTVIHFLLETAMREPDATLDDLAHAALLEQGLDPELTVQAVETVKSVMASGIWKRAMAADQRLVEVPFERCIVPEPGVDDLPTLLRGVIDLAFLEGDGWVIVDYKTDAVSPDSLAKLVDHYRGQLETYTNSWESITGQKVKESGLFFTRLNEYAVL